MDERELGLIAAGVAFFGFLSLFPSVSAVITLWGYAADPVAIRTELGRMQNYLPPQSFTLLSDQVEALIAVNSSQLGVATVASTVVALWSARAGVAALIRGLNAIHGLPQRTGLRHQLRALSLTMVLLGLVLGAMLTTIVGPLLIGFLPLGTFAARALELVQVLVGLVLVVLSIGLAYRIGLNRTGVVLFTPGLVVAVILWALVSRGFVIYLANFGAYNQIYGSIGAVAALLMWMYLSAYAVLLGAAFDASRRPQ